MTGGYAATVTVADFNTESEMTYPRSVFTPTLLGGRITLICGSFVLGMKFTRHVMYLRLFAEKSCPPLLKMTPLRAARLNHNSKAVVGETETMI